MISSDSAAHGRLHDAPRHVYLGLGSNLGDRDAYLRAALIALAPYVQVTRVSSVYATAPLHVTDQPEFHNLAAEGETRLAPDALLRAAKEIERQLGRTAGPRYGPRVIDIDVLLYEDMVLRTPDLIIPHPRLAERAFVLVPLAEIAPELQHPELCLPIATLAGRVSLSGVRRVGPLLPASG
jgi:2-amino-4-hydroxy-6-hydroxymethyldihydropteridine diphosphokinase